MTLLDAGLVTELSTPDRNKFILLFRAIVCNDGFEAGRLIISEYNDPTYKVSVGDAIDFKNGMKTIVEKAHKKGLKLSSMTVASLFEEVFQLSYTYNVKIDPQFISIIISTCILEGLGRRLDPELDLIVLATPYIISAGKKLLLASLTHGLSNLN